VATIEDTDRGAKIGLRWIQGPFEIMNKIGIDRTFDVVEAVARRYPDFKVPQIIQQQKELGKPFAFNFVDLEVKGDIATVTLNRPEAMNALNEAVFTQLEERFSAAEKNPAVKAVVFQGAGKAFVAGADIRYFVQKIKAGRIEDIVAFTRKGHELLLRIENSEKMTIALLDGLSLGGGSELALACQAIVATPAGSMAFPETGIGIFPGLGGMLRFSRHTGPELAKYYTFTGAALSAADATALGIVTKLVAPAEVDAAIADLAAAGKPDKYGARRAASRHRHPRRRRARHRAVYRRSRGGHALRGQQQSRSLGHGPRALVPQGRGLVLGGEQRLGLERPSGPSARRPGRDSPTCRRAPRRSS